MKILVTSLQHCIATILPAVGLFLTSVLEHAAENAKTNGPLQVHPDNPRYFLWQGRPTVLAVADDTVPGNSTKGSPIKVVVVDNFESYTSDQQLAKAWYKPPHGGAIHQSRDSAIKNMGWGGRMGMRQPGMKRYKPRLKSETY